MSMKSNTTGAGDAFIAATLYGILNGLKPKVLLQTQIHYHFCCLHCLVLETNIYHSMNELKTQVDH